MSILSINMRGITCVYIILPHPSLQSISEQKIGSIQKEA